MNTPTLPARGIYQHHKGQHYEVLGNARHSETEEWLVVYRALYGDYGLWVRPLAQFNDNVAQPDGQWRPRFHCIHAYTD